MTFIPSLAFTDFEWFSWSICNGFGMPAGNAYPSGHLTLSPIVGLACAPIVETRFLELPCLYSTFHLEYPLVLSRFCLVAIFGFKGACGVMDMANELLERLTETRARIQWWFVNPGSDNPEISIIRTKSAGTDFRSGTDRRFSNPENVIISGNIDREQTCPD